MSEEHGGWIDAAHKQPAHGRPVLALHPMDNDGYTREAGFAGEPRAWVIARWDAKQNRWGVVDPKGQGNVGVRISWWRELPSPPQGTLIVP